MSTSIDKVPVPDSAVGILADRPTGVGSQCTVHFLEGSEVQPPHVARPSKMRPNTTDSIHFAHRIDDSYSC
jgi:hypothetical protein